MAVGADGHTVAYAAQPLSPHEVTWSPMAAHTAKRGSIEPGAVLAGRYRIIRQLGRGGMGVVYHADDLRLGHAVALKFLPSMLAADEHRLNAFHREVSVARQITHPNVCRVYDIGDADGHLFLSMEYIDGEDLATALARRGALPETEGIDLARQICAGLAAVHAQGVLHRDLTPANIMLDPQGRARLTDFGIASLGPRGTGARDGGHTCLHGSRTPRGAPRLDRQPHLLARTGPLRSVHGAPALRGKYGRRTDAPAGDADVGAVTRPLASDAPAAGDNPQLPLARSGVPACVINRRPWNAAGAVA